MELKRLRIKNFLGIGEGEVRFDKAGVVLVEGINDDSPSSLSNGAGKSSIFEALYWVLFGKTKRGLLGDDVVNNTAKKNCVVELEFDDFSILRTRKDDVLGSTLKFYQERGDGSGRKDLTLGTARDTQKLIEETIKLSELTFSKVAYFGQADIRGFAGLTDADLKKVFEQALGLTFFAIYQEKVKLYRTEQELVYRENEARHRDALRERIFIEEKIDLLKRSIQDQEATERSERKRLENDLSEIGRLMIEVRTSTENSLFEIASKIDSLKAHDEERKHIEALLKETENEARSVEADLIRCQMQREVLANDLQEIEEAVMSLEEKLGNSCGECGRAYGPEDIFQVEERLNARYGNTLAAYQESLGREEAMRAGSGELAERRKLLNAQLSLRQAELAELSDLRAQQEYIARTGHDRFEVLAEREKDIKHAIQSLILNSHAEESPLKRGLEEHKAELSAVEEEIKKLQLDLEVVSSEIETAKALEEILGNSGLKSYVFDAITPQLNRLIDKNIKLLDDIDIELSTVTKLKSGGFREKFAINVANHHGASVFEGNSGGEMQKINLAISLAINNLIRTVSEGSINAIFLDECFENLDEGSSERVLELIRSIDTPNVFLITHRSGLKELLPSSIIVEKRGGKAVVK